MVVVVAQAASLEAVHLEAVAPLGHCPEEPHHGLPLPAVRSAGRAVDVEYHHVRSLVGYGLSQKGRWMADQECRVVAHQTGAVGDDSHLTRGLSPQVEANARHGNLCPEMARSDPEQPKRVLCGLVFQLPVSRQLLSGSPVAHPRKDSAAPTPPWDVLPAGAGAVASVPPRSGTRSPRRSSRRFEGGARRQSNVSAASGTGNFPEHADAVAAPGAF